MGAGLMNGWGAGAHIWFLLITDSNFISPQGGMELRVLFPAAFRSTWYGRWGYAFGRGGFGIKPAAWRRAATAVHDASLVARLRQSPAGGGAPARVVARYQVCDSKAM